MFVLFFQLDDLNKNIDNLESKASREFAPTPPPADPKDGELQKFVENLSPEDEELMEVSVKQNKVNS